MARIYLETMAASPFVDYVKVYLTSGNGGKGSVHWRREMWVPKGGPDGGDGGEGGSVYLEGNQNLWTLLDLKYRKFIKAGHGENGGGQRKSGKKGKDEILEVPLGTVIKNAETGEVVAEVKKHQERILILPGGLGGKGNFHFKSSTNQTPEYAQGGLPGQEMTAIIELKVLADVGLVGFPNAGKSTLLSVLTAAKPKIADYPFTTLVPNLGIVKYRGFGSYVIADIPGIIEGAHAGKGLGHQFLRHIERNPVLLFMISVECDDIKAEFETLKNELKQYDPDLIHKDKLLAITKCDMMDEEMLEELKADFPEDVKCLMISSVVGKGLEELSDELWKLIEANKNWD